MRRAIAINPFERLIREVTLADDGIEPMYAQLRADDPRFSGTFTTVGLPNGDTLFVDDEGCLEQGRTCFLLAGYPQPLAGSGLIVPETNVLRTSVAEACKIIQWTTLVTTGGFTPMREYDAPDPFTGKGTIRVLDAGQPIFWNPMKNEYVTTKRPG